MEKIAQAFRVLVAGTIILAGIFAFPPSDQARDGGATSDGVFGSNVRVDDTGDLMEARGLGPHAFVAENGTIYVVWDDGRAAPGTMDQDDLYFAISFDGGRTYTRNVPVAVTANLSGGNSDIVVAEDGMIFVVWGERIMSTGIGHIFFALSTDGGNTFSSPVVIDGHRWDEDCVAGGLALTRYGDLLFAAWIQSAPDPRGLGFFLARSTNRGATWQSPVRIDDAGFDDIQSPGLAVDDAGTLYAVWADWTRNEIRLATSFDFGVTFGSSVVVSPSGWIVLTAAVAARDAQEAYVAWSTRRSPTNNAGTVFLSRVIDGGLTVLPSTKVTDLSPNSTRETDPSIAVAGPGFVYVAWTSNRTDRPGDVYFARSIDGGLTLEANERIVDLPLSDGTRQNYADVAANANGSVVVVWTDGRRDVSTSWGGDIYSAVPTYLPDLAVNASDISLSPSSPREGDRVVINATTRNIGWAVSSSTTARFYNGTPPAPQIGSDQPLPPLRVNESANVSVTWTAPPPGTYDVCVVADPDNLVAESNETNNVACIQVQVLSLPDLLPRSLDINPQSPLPDGTTAVVNVTVANQGDLSAGGFDLLLFDDRDGDMTPDTGENVSLSPLAGLAGHSQTNVSFTWTASPVGNNSICAFVDPPPGTVNESNEANNAECLSVLVQPVPVTMPDYVPAQAQPPPPVKVGLSLPVSLSIVVHNQGNATASNDSILAFYNESSPANPFASFNVSAVPPGGNSSRFTAMWTSPAFPGTCNVTVDVDHWNNVTEWDETNNVYAWTIEVVPGPVTSLDIGSPNYTSTATYVTSSTLLSLSVIDRGGSGINYTKYRIDNVTWYDYTGTPFFLSGEKDHYVEYYSEDSVGNVEDVNHRVLRVDDTSPVTNLLIGDPKYLVGGNFVNSSTPLTLHADDGGLIPVGTNDTFYRLWSGTWSSWREYASSFTLIGRDGTWFVEFLSFDFLGNREGVQNVTLTLDNTPPSLSIDPEETTVLVDTHFSISADDAQGSGVASVEYRTDGGEWTPYSSPFALGVGHHLIDYRSSDNLNNSVGGSLSVNVVAPETPPEGRVEVNYKPLIALLFSILIAVAAAYSSKRRPLSVVKDRKRKTLFSWAILGIPFVGAEAATGILSLYFEPLRIPPVVGWGTGVDVTILVAGIVFLLLRLAQRKGTKPKPQGYNPDTQSR